MPTCPNCGSYVPLGNHSCSCGTSIGGSRRSKYYDEEEERNSGTRSFFDHLTTYEQYALFYENSLSLARRTPYDEFAIRYYKEAVEHGFDYWKEIEDKPDVKPTIPKTNELLASEDVEKCCEIYRNYYSKRTSILHYKEIDDIIELLTKTGNEQAYKNVIKEVSDKRKAERERREREYQRYNEIREREKQQKKEKREKKIQEAKDELKQMKLNAEKKVNSFLREMDDTYAPNTKKIFEEFQKPNKPKKSKDSKRIRIKID
ncbi:hypothetical protein [Methanobrevibacter sp.]|uniref:hypothetical protein n=1 Tax=Methanobrevibacter sp. TaxID=66852 RepID=UPI00388D2DA4